MPFLWKSFSSFSIWNSFPSGVTRGVKGGCRTSQSKIYFLFFFSIIKNFIDWGLDNLLRMEHQRQRNVYQIILSSEPLIFLYLQPIHTSWRIPLVTDVCLSVCVQETAGSCHVWECSTLARGCSTAWCRQTRAVSRTSTPACSGSACGGAASGWRCSWTTVCPPWPASSPSSRASTPISSGPVFWRRRTPSKYTCTFLTIVAFRGYKCFLLIMDNITCINNEQLNEI